MSDPADAFLRGIFPALVTPLHRDGSVNLQSFERLLERVYLAGAHGVYVCGSTGEGLRMNMDARQLVTESAVRNSPAGKQVIVHVGAPSLEDTLNLARHASALSVSAVSSLPLANMPAEGLAGFYRAIAAAASVPVVAYYFPGFTGYSLSFEQLAEICEIPGVSGVKFTDYDLYALSLLSDRGVKILNGRDEILLAGLLMGAAGGIGSIYNLIPGRFVELFRLASQGEWEKARKLQLHVTRFITVLLSFPLLPAIKQALAWGGIECGRTLGSPSELTEDQKARLRTELDAFKELLAA